MALPARAAIINHSVGFQITQEFRGTSPSLDFNAAIPFFDPSLGTLNQVDIIYDFDLSLMFSVSNRTLDPVTFTLGANQIIIEGTRFFDRFAFNRIVATHSIDQTDYTAPAGTERTIGSITLVLSGRLSEQFDVDRRFSRTSRPLVIRDIVLRPQGDMSPFIGTGDKILEFDAFTQSPLSLPSSGSILNGVSSSTSWLLAGSVDVTYDFTPAPEPVPLPAAMPLLLSGLMCIRFFSIRKRQSNF